MATTPLGFPYPAFTDNANGPSAIQALATALDTYLQTGLDFAAWAPVLSSAGSAPTLGTGGTASGAQAIIGNFHVVMFGFAFGTSPGAGTGAYLVAMPTAIAYGATGSAILKKSGGKTSYTPSPPPSDSTHVQFDRGDGTTSSWGAASPSAPANGDLFQGFYIYQSA